MLATGQGLAYFNVTVITVITVTVIEYSDFIYISPIIKSQKCNAWVLPNTPESFVGS